MQKGNYFQSTSIKLVIPIKLMSVCQFKEMINLCYLYRVDNNTQNEIMRINQKVDFKCKKSRSTHCS